RVPGRAAGPRRQGAADLRRHRRDPDHPHRPGPAEGLTPGRVATTRRPPMPDRVTVTITDGVADVRLNRPDKLNALDGEMFTALADAGARPAADRSVRPVVPSGEGRAHRRPRAPPPPPAPCTSRRRGR